jgi:hypothetical protein
MQRLRHDDHATKLGRAFGRLNNDELVSEFQSGGLTELAREVAAAEIESRSIKISQYQARLPEPRPEPEMDSDALTYQNIIGGALGGGVRVLVPESYFARAAEIKSRIDSGTYTLDDNAG